MNLYKSIAKWSVATVMALLLSFSSFNFAGTTTNSSNLGANVACANGSCCPANAICGLNGENYQGYEYNPGPCSGDQPIEEAK